MAEEYLVVSKPNPVVCNGEGENMVHKRLTLRMVAWGGKGLQQKKMNEFSQKIQFVQLFKKKMF